MGTVNVNPTQHQADPPFTQFANPTLFGAAATIAAAMSDSDDTTGFHWGTAFVNVNHGMFLQFLDLWSHVPTNARIDWIQPHFRARHSAFAGYIWAYDLRAFSPVTTRWPVEAGLNTKNPTRYLGLARSYPANVTDGIVADVDCPVSRAADDGTPWNDCWYFTIYFGRWWDGYIESYVWDSSNYPYATKCYVTVGYTKKPLIQNITPSGTITDPRPLISWGIGDLEGDHPAAAYHLRIFPPGSTDANGVVLGDSGYDPYTGSGLAYDSMRVNVGSTSHQVTSVLAPGTWHIFVREAVGTGIEEYVSDWGTQSFVLNALTVDQPDVSLSDDTASNTVRVTIDAGTHVADLVADTIEVQYLDAAYGWVAAPIADSMVNGTGTSVFFDGLHAPGEIVSYRARGIGVFDGAEYASSWTTATFTVGDLEQWWLRSSSDYTLNRSLHNESYLLMRSWQPQRKRPAAITWGIGARTATSVHDVTKGDVHSCSVWCMTHAAYTDLRALLEDGDDLVLVNPWGEIWRVQAGDQVSEEVIKAAPRSDETTQLGFVRILTFDLVEVVTP